MTLSMHEVGLDIKMEGKEEEEEEEVERERSWGCLSTYGWGALPPQIACVESSLA